MTQSIDGTEHVVSPLGNRPSAGAAVERKNGGLAGARVAFAWDYLFHGDRMWELIVDEMSRRWPDITFVEHDQFDNFHDKFSDDVTSEGLKHRMRELEIDAAVVGVGA